VNRFFCQLLAPDTLGQATLVGVNLELVAVFPTKALFVIGALQRQEKSQLVEILSFVRFLP
jgi:hypothetical protein